MPDNYQKIDQIYFSVRKLLDRQQALEQEKTELQEENRALQEKVEAEQARVAELERQLKMLKLARQIGGNDDEANEHKAELKRKINEYIREIDGCIAMLKSE